MSFQERKQAVGRVKTDGEDERRVGMRNDSRQKEGEGRQAGERQKGRENSRSRTERKRARKEKSNMECLPRQLLKREASDTTL